jgi:hypothetical protein
MIKYKKLIALELEKYPAKCNDCPMFYTTRYQCHNECGIEGHCELGYMDGYDMRDFYGDGLFELCNIKNDSRVRIVEDLA